MRHHSKPLRHHESPVLLGNLGRLPLPLHGEAGTTHTQEVDYQPDFQPDARAPWALGALVTCLVACVQLCAC